MIARRRAAGFTLVELLMVVAIVGVLVGLGVFLLRGRPRAVDVAAQLSAKIAEASRQAVATGSVRNDVAAALGSDARTRTVITVAANGGSVTLDRLEEDPLPAATATWLTLSTLTLHEQVRVSGYKASADLTGGVAVPDVPLVGGDQLEVRCYPDGRCDGMTIYIATIDGKRKARVVIMPLGGSPVTFDSW